MSETPLTTAEQTTTDKPTTDQTTADRSTDGAPEADPWTAFAPAVPSRPRLMTRALDRIVDGTDRFIHQEWVLACAAGLCAAVAMTWPVLRHPTTSLPDNLAGSAAEAAQLTRSGHALASDPGGFLQATVLDPGSGADGLTAGLLGFAPIGMIGSDGASEVLRYNIVFVLAFALAAAGTYALVRQLGAGRIAATVAAAAFAFAPWRLGQAGHLAVLFIGGIPLAFAMIARGHGWSLRPRTAPVRSRAGWAAGGWLIAAWQISLGLETGLPFAYVLLALAVVAAIRWLVRLALRQRPGHRRPAVRPLLLGIDLIGLACCATVAGGLTRAARLSSPAADTVAAASSPPLRGFLTAPEESLLWGGAHAPVRAALTSAADMAVLPGFFLLALALAGLAVSTWRWHQRVLLLAGVAVSGWLAMGGAGPADGRFGYVPIADTVPGFDVVRAPNWLVLWTTLLLAFLAAGAVDSLVSQITPVADQLNGTFVRSLTRRTLRVALFLPLVLVVAEGLPSYATPAVSAVQLVLGSG